MRHDDPLLEQALRELAEFVRDSHRESLLHKFTCPESRQLSQLLGAALERPSGYSPPPVREACLPVPAGLVHPG